MIIDIGSGPHPKGDADVRMDLHRWPYVNCLHDMLVTPYPFTDNLFSKAYMGDVVEHILIFDVDRVLNEVHRILMPAGLPSGSSRTIGKSSAGTSDGSISIPIPGEMP